MWFYRDVYMRMIHLNNSSYYDKQVHKPKIVSKKLNPSPRAKSTVDNKK